MTSDDKGQDTPATPAQEPAPAVEPAKEPAAPADDGDSAPATIGYHTAADDQPKPNTSLLLENGLQGTANQGDEKQS